MWKTAALAVLLLTLRICTAQGVVTPSEIDAGQSRAAAPGAAPVARQRSKRSVRKAAHQAAALARIEAMSTQINPGPDDGYSTSLRKRARSAQTGLTGERLAAAIAEAQQAAEKRVEAHAEVWAQEIGEAPADLLISGVDDISSSGPCRSEIDKYCTGMKPGEGHFADCLSQQLAVSEASLATFPDNFTMGCMQDLDEYRHERARNINMNVPLARACKKDAKKLCSDPGDTYAIMWCLRSQPDLLRQRCYSKLFGAVQVAGDDIRAAPALYDACKADLKRHCKKTSFRHGKAQQCLRKAGSKLDWSCREELFKDAMANSDDVRLSTQMFRVCLDDKKKFCPLVEPGHSRAISCLENSREEPGFSAPCKDALEWSMSERARDFRLDPTMRKACKKDIERTCGVELDALKKGIEEKTKVEDDGAVVGCLQDYRHELQDPDCTLAVHTSLVRAVADVRFAPTVSNACYEDRRKLCGSVPTGSARVWSCLQEMRAQLSSDCKAALFDSEVSSAESIDFQYPLKKACPGELEHFCKAVSRDHASVIRCLQDNEMQPLFSETCRDELRNHDHHAAHDYRLNSRLRQACDHVMNELCSHIVCPEDVPCGGRMLRCLADNVDSIQSISCRNEVTYYQKMGVQDFESDVMVAEACHKDVDKFCKKVPRGKGRMHECLFRHSNELSEECAKEELRLTSASWSNFELQPSLARDCAEERTQHCPTVLPGMSRIFNCLIAKADSVDFSPGCRSNIAGQHQRRMEDWRLDFNLRKNCAGNVGTFCNKEEAATGNQTADGQVLQCLLMRHGSLDMECAVSVTRTIHSSLKFYRPGLPITRACDADVERHCIPPALLDTWQSHHKANQSKLAALGPQGTRVPIGQVLSCLETFSTAAASAAEGTSAIHRSNLAGVKTTYKSTAATRAVGLGKQEGSAAATLTKKCSALVDMGAPELFNDYLEVLSSGRLATTLRKVQDAMDLPEETLVTTTVSHDDEAPMEGLTLTGWSAVAGAGALTLLVLLAILSSWRRFIKARYGSYQMVSKSQRPAEVQMR